MLSGGAIGGITVGIVVVLVLMLFDMDPLPSMLAANIVIAI